MNLEEHLHILRNLPIPYKAALIKILWIIFMEHQEEIKDLDKDVISKVIIPRAQQNWKNRAYKRTNIDRDRGY